MAAETPRIIAEFFAHLPTERQCEVDRVRRIILQHLPAGYEEVISKNMLVYQVPLTRYPDTYNGRPLRYIALASEKSYLSLHLMSIYGEVAQALRLKEGFRTAGKKLDMGKACIHFRTADDLPLDVLGAVIAECATRSLGGDRPGGSSPLDTASDRGAVRQQHLIPGLLPAAPGGSAGQGHRGSGPGAQGDFARRPATSMVTSADLS